MDVPRLIVRPQQGLANRMRVISSFQILARRSGRVFELCWAPSNGWSDEDIDTLFENRLPRVPPNEFEIYHRNGLNLNKARRIAGRDDDGNRMWEWREGSGMHQVFDLEAFPVVTYSGQATLFCAIRPVADACYGGCVVQILARPTSPAPLVKEVAPMR